MNSVLEFMNNDHARLDGLFRESSELCWLFHWLEEIRNEEKGIA